MKAKLSIALKASSLFDDDDEGGLTETKEVVDVDTDFDFFRSQFEESESFVCSKAENSVDFEAEESEEPIACFDQYGRSVGQMVSTDPPDGGYQRNDTSQRNFGSLSIDEDFEG
jgi:hypothetical protein